MSFIENNKNFLKFEFQIPLRGLIGSEKEMKYIQEIRPEARRRIRLYYQSVKNDISSKIIFYKDLLEIFGSLEEQFLLYSIFLESDLDGIKLKLKPTILQYLEPNNKDSCNYFQPKAASNIMGFLKQYFTEILDLTSDEWKAVDGTKQNPITYKLIGWMKDKITKNSKASELREFILNYTKLWNIYFCNPYNFTKGLILLHKFQEMYSKLDPQDLKVDLKALLIDLNEFTGGLLPDVYNSPLTDVSTPPEILKVGLNDSNSLPQSYLKKLNEFQESLTMNSFFFLDLKSFSWPDLLFKASTTQSPAQMAFFNEIKRRHTINDVPKFNEIDEFLIRIYMIEIPINRHILESIATPNYIFFL